MHIWTRHFSSHFLPCWLFVFGKPHHLALLVPGDQTKKLSAVMAAYLLCRCKHLYMLVFRVLILILTYLFVSRHEVRSVNTRAVHNAGR